MRVISKRNGGLADARNVGLKHAKVCNLTSSSNIKT
jgi:glycosyltransferase involved in cell wall biosynthesis